MPKITPPVASEYQLMIPADVVAVKITVPVTQTLPGIVLAIVGIGFTVTVTFALAGLEQPAAFNASA